MGARDVRSNTIKGHSYLLWSSVEEVDDGRARVPGLGPALWKEREVDLIEGSERREGRVSRELR